jgi:hypothetical protein
MIVALVRHLFVLPGRIQKWIDRGLILIGILLFLKSLWERIKDHKPKSAEKSQ